MLDSVFKQGTLKENSYLVEKAIKEIKASGRTPICNVVTKYDLPSGQDVSVASFRNLYDAQVFLNISFEENCKTWAEDQGYKIEHQEDESIEDFIHRCEPEAEVSIEDTTAHLHALDSYITMYITVNKFL